MTTLTRLRSDVAFVAAPRLFTGVSAIAVNVWALQHLTPDAYGAFAFCAAGLLLFDGLVCASLDLGVLRRDLWQRGPGDLGLTPVERAALGTKLVLGALLVGSALLFGERAGAALFDAPGGRWLFALTAFGGAALLVLHTVQVHCQALRRPRAFGAIELAHAVVRLVLVAAIIATASASALTMVAAYALAPLIVSAAALAMYGRRVPSISGAAMAELRPLAQLAATAFATLGLGAIIARLDLFALGWFSTPTELGLFSAALVIAMVPEFLGIYLSPAMTPRIAAKLRDRSLSQFFWRSQALLAAACLALLIVGLMVIGPAIDRLVPVRYQPAAEVVRVLLPGSLTGLFLFPVALNVVLLTNCRLLVRADCVALPLLAVAYAYAASRGGALGVAWLTSIYKLAKALLVHGLAARAARQSDRRDAPGADADLPGMMPAPSAAGRGVW